jgi:uncharacterized membrane protein
MKILYLYFFTAISFFAIDMVWIGGLAKDFYKNQIGFLMGPVNWTAAVFFYALYIGGIIYFAVYPHVKTDNWLTFLLNGALLGLICYATYDLTNMATLKNWPWRMVWIDIIWGMVLTGCTALASGLIAQKWLEI